MRLNLLLLSLLLGASCGRQEIRTTLPPGVRLDSYLQHSAAAVDVLWVVDNSGSMAPYQQTVARNFQSFITLFTRGAIDYRIAVTTTDIFKQQGQFVGNPTIITPQTSDPVGSFETNVKVGITGSAYEAGFEAARISLARQAKANAPLLTQIAACESSCPRTYDTAQCAELCSTAYPIAFLRPSAYLYVIFVSDDDDDSASDPRYYWRTFADIKGVGNDGTVITAAITGDAPVTPCGATLGARYIQMAQLTNGEVGTICDVDFARTLRRLATSAVGLKRKFALSRPPIVSTLSVTLTYPCNESADVLALCATTDNSQCTPGAPTARVLACSPRQGGQDGWSYEPSTNVIFFAGDSVPDVNAGIDIQYKEVGTP